MSFTLVSKTPWVLVQVAHVTTKFARSGQTDQGIHVGAINIDTSAVRVHQSAHGLHTGLKDTVGAGSGGSRHHQIRPERPDRPGHSCWRHQHRHKRRASAPKRTRPSHWSQRHRGCWFRWLTSPPNSPGAARPTRAFMLAPSTYTRAPCECTNAHNSFTLVSKTP